MMMRDGFDVEKSTGVVKSATGFWGLRLFFFESLGVDDLYVWLRVGKNIINAVLVKKIEKSPS